VQNNKLSLSLSTAIFEKILHTANAVSEKPTKVKYLIADPKRALRTLNACLGPISNRSFLGKTLEEELHSPKLSLFQGMVFTKMESETSF